MDVRSLEFSENEIAGFCDSHHIVKLALFGSVLRDDFRPESDVDILVEFEPEHTPGLLRVAAMERELSRLMSNRKVDLRTLEDLSRYFRDSVARNAVVLYERSLYG